MSMSRTSSRFAAGLLLPALLLLAACGGGGGGGGGSGGGSAPVVYGGNTNPADVTTANASSLTADVIGSGDTVGIIGGVSIESGDATQNQSSGLTDLARRLNRSFRDIVVRAEQASSTQRVVTAGLVDGVCDGGSISTTGTLGSDGTGTVMVSLNNCLIDGITLNGPATLRVDAVSFPFPSPTDFTLSFVRLTLRGPGFSIDTGGTLRTQLSFGTTETITANLVSLDNSTTKVTKTENLMIVNLYDNLEMPSFFTETVSGRVFDSVHGFVDITTVVPLFFGTINQLFPTSGQLLLKGALMGVGNRSILVSALSSTMVWLELDLDGDGVRENTAFLKWTELSGPVGADLADDDGDRLHNSWEMANGLLRNNAADAAQDSDSDGSSNLKEYFGGGDPNVAAVVPSLGNASLTIATLASNEFIVGKSGLASDGARYLLVSCRTTGIFGVFVSGATAGEIFPIVSGNCTDGGIGSENDITQPNVAFDGTNYLVVFVKGAIINGIRVSQSGTVLDGPSGFAISTGQLFTISNTSPAVAFDGANYLVVWRKFVPIVGVGTRNIYGARVTPAGQALGEIPISTEQNTAPEQFGFAVDMGAPSLAFDGTNYLVVWNKVRTGPGSSIYSSLFAIFFDVSGARVSSQGLVLDPQEIVFSTSGPLSQSPSAENVKIAFDGTNHLAVWRKVLTIGFDPPSAEIRGTRVTPDGSLLDGPSSGEGFGINTIALGKSEPAVAFDGTNFLVAWVVGAFPNSPPAGMFGAIVSPSGQVIDGLPTTIGTSLSIQPTQFARFLFPVASSNGTNVLLTWFDNVQLAGQPNSLPGALVFLP